MYLFYMDDIFCILDEYFMFDNVRIFMFDYVHYNYG